MSSTVTAFILGPLTFYCCHSVLSLSLLNQRVRRVLFQTLWEKHKRQSRDINSASVYCTCVVVQTVCGCGGWGLSIAERSSVMTGSDRQEAWGVNKGSVPYQRSKIEISAAVRPHEGPLMMSHLCWTTSNYNRRRGAIPEGRCGGGR